MMGANFTRISGRRIMMDEEHAPGTKTLEYFPIHDPSKNFRRLNKELARCARKYCMEKSINSKLKRKKEFWSE